MSRARDLANYISTGVTAAELDQLDTTSGTPGSGNFLRGDKTWVAAGGGKIVQVVKGTTVEGTTTTASNTFQVKATPVVVITPTSATNQILILGSIMGDNRSDQIYIDLHRSIAGGASTDNLSGYDNGMTYIYTGASAPDRVISSFSCTWVDETYDTTDSAITYKFSFRNSNGSTTIYIGGSQVGQMLTAIEIDV